MHGQFRESLGVSSDDDRRAFPVIINQCFCKSHPSTVRRNRNPSLSKSGKRASETDTKQDAERDTSTNSLQVRTKFFEKCFDSSEVK